MFFILLCIGLTAARIYAEERPYRIGASLGGSFTGFRDEISAPNRYLNALTYIIDANIEKNKLLHSFNLYFYIGNARMYAPYAGYEHKQYISGRGHFEYALDYRLWGNSVFPGYLGGASRLLVHFSNSADVMLSTPATGFGLLSLDLHASQKWIINEKNVLVFTIAYPLIGYAVRPPFAGLNELWAKYLDEKSYLKIIGLGNTASFHNYWAVFGNVRYQYGINKLVSLNCGLGFELSRINIPKQKPRRDAIFRLNAGVAFTF